MENNIYELQFSPRIIDLFHSRMLVGQLSNMDQIISIQTSFHDENDNIILDNFGNPIQYISYRQDLGHVLEILYPKSIFSYVKCRFSLQPNSNFDPYSLFFHFLQQAPSPTFEGKKQHRMLNQLSKNHCK